MQSRYHIQLKDRRTTITMDTVASELLAVMLKVEPNSKEAHTTIRIWLNEAVTEALGDDIPSNSRISTWARRLAIEAIARPKLMNQVIEHRIAD